MSRPPLDFPPPRAPVARSVTKPTRRMRLAHPARVLHAPGPHVPAETPHLIANSLVTSRLLLRSPVIVTPRQMSRPGSQSLVLRLHSIASAPNPPRDPLD